MTDTPAVGDLVEVLHLTLDGGEVAEVWTPATVAYITPQQLGVTFSGGERLALPLRGQTPKRWRAPPAAHLGAVAQDRPR